MDFPVNILIVDDHPENLVAIEAVLTGEPYRLVRAYSGLEALRFLLIEEFAVIVMDVQMPDMDGFETARMIRAREKTKYVPIIFLSATYIKPDNYDFTGNLVGAVDYMVKPFIPQIFKSKIEGFVSMYEANHALQAQSEFLRKQSKQLERTNLDLMQAKEVSENVSKTKTELLAMMSKEFRKPLNRIIENSDTLRSMGLPKDCRELAESIHTNSHALLSIINQIMEISSIESE